MGDDLFSKFIDRLFDMRKSTYFFILIFILGALLRLIAAINLSVAADDMHFVTFAINFFAANKLVTWGGSSGLWDAFTSIAYNLFGTTQFASRFATLLFGTFTIPAIYLLSKEFFNEKISLISAFLLAISPFHIKLTTAEMDAMVMFFAVVSMVLFIRALKTNKPLFFILSGIFLGLGVYTKVYPFFFMPSLLLYAVYTYKKNNNKVLSNKNIKNIFIFLFAIFIFCLPVLIHNYLLYKDKGFLDEQTTRFTGIGRNISAQYYSWDAHFSQKNSWAGLFLGDKTYVASGKPLLLWAIDVIRLNSPINFYLGILGIIIILLYKKEHKNYLIFFLLSIAIILPYLASSVLLIKHYLFLELFLTPLSAFSLTQINIKLQKITKKDNLFYLFVIILIFSLIFLGYPKTSHPFYAKSYVAQAIEFKEASIPKTSLIVVDSRIYRGTVHWMSYGRPYLEGTEFLYLLNQQESLPGNTIPVDIYFIECAIDDCGWGTISGQPEFNASMEGLKDFFDQNGQLVKKIKEPRDQEYYFPLVSKEKITEYLRIYHLTTPLKESVLSYAAQPKNWFLYTIGYFPVEQNFDYYTTHNSIDRLIDKIAHFVVLIALILAILSPLFIIYLLYKEGLFSKSIKSKM